MPSASTAKLEKQASSEATDPIKQGIVLVDHKIRNLMKKKSRLDSYREIQKNGKELDSDQKQALLKYDELCQNLSFAQELSKQLNTIAVDYIKQQKKKEKQEAYEREKQEAARVKEILIIQDVLASMGAESVREDFLAGRNKAVKLTEAELQYLDDLFTEVSPKREPEENQPPFVEQVVNAAKHLLSIVDGKDKEIVGTKYSVLKELVDKINNCGYFDASSGVEPVSQEPEEVPQEVIAPEPAVPEAEPEEPELAPLPTTTFQPSIVEAPVVETAGLYITQRPMADVLNNVMGPGPTAFNFIQQSPAEGAGDWTEAPEQNNDWSMNDQGDSQWSEPTPTHTQPAEEWNDNSNDGFQTAGRGGGRGGRGRGGSSDRGRGGPRGGRGNSRGNYQNGRGGGSYNKNNEGSGNHYQNGYQSRGDGYQNRGEGYQNRGEGYQNRGEGYQNRGEGYQSRGEGYQSRGDGYRERRGGPRGGSQGPRPDRGAPRGGGGRGGPRGNNRGSRQ